MTVKVCSLEMVWVVARVIVLALVHISPEVGFGGCRCKGKGVRLLLQDLKNLGLEKTKLGVVLRDQFVRFSFFAWGRLHQSLGWVNVLVVEHGRELDYLIRTASQRIIDGHNIPEC